jgi:hypothetical protein
VWPSREEKHATGHRAPRDERRGRCDEREPIGISSRGSSWCWILALAFGVSCAEPVPSEGPPSPVALADFWAQFDAARRDAERLGPRPDLVVPRTWEFDGNYRFNVRALREGVAAGTIRYDPAAAGCFLHRLRTASDVAFFELWRGCAPVLIGVRVEGEPCHTAFECQGGMICNHGAGDRPSCPGVCRGVLSIAEPGEDCSWDGACRPTSGYATRCATFNLQPSPGAPFNPRNFRSVCLRTEIQPAVTEEGGECIRPWPPEAFNARTNVGAFAVWRPCARGMNCVVHYGATPGAEFGNCRREVPIGGRCSRDAPCREGLSCRENTAGALTCMTDFRAERACTTDTECLGWTCRSGRCVELGHNEGSFCINDRTCYRDLRCDQELLTCVPRLADGSPCTQDLDCQSRTCTLTTGATGSCSHRICL